MPFDILKDDNIPIKIFAGKLFDDTSRKQKIIPFLGAGVSLSGRPPKNSHEIDFCPPAKEEIDRMLSSMNLKSNNAKDFMELAICIALNMDSLDRQREEGQGGNNYLQSLESNTYPPSATELAEMFSDLSSFSSFEQAIDKVKRLLPEQPVHKKSELLEIIRLLVKITGVCPSTEPLSSISNYYQAVGSRDGLWDTLHKIFAPKKEFTTTHELIARSAKCYLEQEPKVNKDYLIITTNYDCLMESALHDYGVPYAVLALNRNDGKIFVRFSKDDKDLKDDNPPRYPDKFYLQHAKPMVVLYKIHGCLYKELDKTHDGIVITDDDYVDFISRMSKNDGAIPSHVGVLLNDLPFLFLGYSLNDWNVRSIFNMLVERRGSGVQDYSVMLSCKEYEKEFYRKKGIIIIQSDLNDFAKRVLEHAPKVCRIEEAQKSD